MLRDSIENSDDDRNLNGDQRRKGLTRSLRGDETEQAEADRTVYEGRLTRARSSLTDLKASRGDAEEKLTAAQAEILHLKEENARQTKALQAALQKSQKDQDEISRGNDRLLEARGKEIDSLRLQISSITAEKESLKSECSKLREFGKLRDQQGPTPEMRALQSAFQRTSKEVEQLKADRMELKDANMQQMHAFSEELKQRSNEAEAHRIEHEKLKQRSSEAEAHKIEHEKLKQRSSEAEAHRIKHEKLIADKDKRINDLQADQLAKQVDSLLSLLNSFQNTRKQVEEENRALKSKIQDLLERQKSSRRGQNSAIFDEDEVRRSPHRAASHNSVEKREKPPSVISLRSYSPSGTPIPTGSRVRLNVQQSDDEIEDDSESPAVLENRKRKCQQPAAANPKRIRRMDSSIPESSGEHLSFAIADLSDDRSMEGFPLRDELSEQMASWELKIPRWRVVPSAHCLNVRASRSQHHNAPPEEGHACEFCRRNGKLCCVVKTSGTLTMMPVDKSGQHSQNNVAFWIKSR
ncbi:MAG: hypothetical protein Q9160_001406 [Pyrenula sp. 1 TL-2023]